MKRSLYTLVFLLVSSFLFGQETIYLQNPSFEGMPRVGKAPDGWYDCGFPTESPPDVQPSSQNISPFFDVIQTPSDGNTYIGMVVRDNDTWEMVAQRLKTPLSAGIAYYFSVDLCRSEIYVSPSRVTGQEVNYTSPVKLRIWGGNGFCDKVELLSETPLIINTHWLTHDLVMMPTEDFEYLVFECFYKTPILFPYNGNLLMDNASPIIEIPIEMADSLAALSPKKPKLTQRDYITSESGNPPREIPQLTVEEVDSIDNANREWSSAGDFTKPIRDLLEEMEIYQDDFQFSIDTKSQLQNILFDLDKSKEYTTIVFGILGDKKRRKQLSQPIEVLVRENGLSDQIKIVKVQIGDLDENWVGKNQYYRIRLE